MKILSSDQVNKALSYPSLIDALEEAYAGQFQMPPRSVHLLDKGGNGKNSFALLPSWNDFYIGLKAFTYFPDNVIPDKTLYAKILLFERKNGEPVALVDGTSVTCWRTAGVSALASRLLSREDSQTLFLLGTGNLAPFIIKAHASVRNLQKVIVWGRDEQKAAKVISEVKESLPTITFETAVDIQSACTKADIIVSATGSPQPLVKGEWISEGTHTDFLGNHFADKQECDTELVLKSRVYVDSKDNCFKEAGEILVPISEGAITKDFVIGELADLCAGTVPSRNSDEEITLFKSVGTALSDLVAASQVFKY